MKIIKKIIKRVGESYLLVFIIAWIAIFGIALTKVDLSTALFGSAFFSLFFAVFIHLLAYAANELLFE